MAKRRTRETRRIEEVLREHFPSHPPEHPPESYRFNPASIRVRVVDESFSQRRKTMRSALVRLGMSRDDAIAALARCRLDPDVRPERLGLEAFACLTDALATSR